MSFQDVLASAEKSLKIFALAQLANLEKDFGDGTGPVKFKAISDTLKPYALTLVNDVEALIPVVGTLLNSAQIDAVESQVWDSSTAKLDTMLAHGVQNLVDALKSLPILKF